MVLAIWLSALALHSALFVGLAVLMCVQAYFGYLAWLPDFFTQGYALGACLVSAPILAVLVGAKGPRPTDWTSPAPERRRRVGRRAIQVAAFVLMFPIALILGTIDHQIAPVATTIAIGCVAMLVLLCPWVVLYARWFDPS